MNADTDPSETLQQLLQRLLAAQRYAVLATENGGQPYTSLMAFAVADDLATLTLATERGTRKYANLTGNPRVALFIDDRENVGGDTRDAVAITVLGDADELTGADCDSWRAAYVARHPYLADFANSPSCAIISVRVRSYTVVKRFQEVEEWQLA